MARSNVPMKVNIRQNQNDKSKIYGKWFLELATYDMLVLVLQNVVSCMKELMSQRSVRNEAAASE